MPDFAKQPKKYIFFDVYDCDFSLTGEILSIKAELGESEHVWTTNATEMDCMLVGGGGVEKCYMHARSPQQ